MHTYPFASIDKNAAIPESSNFIQASASVYMRPASGIAFQATNYIYTPTEVEYLVMFQVQIPWTLIQWKDLANILLEAKLKHLNPQLWKNIQNLQIRINIFDNEISSLEPVLHSRSKHTCALLPFFGDIFSYVGGLARNKDLVKLQSVIQMLHKKHQNIS